MARPKNLRRNEGRAGRVSVTGSNKRRQNDKAVQRPVGILNLAAQPDKCGHDIQAANEFLVATSIFRVRSATVVLFACNRVSNTAWSIFQITVTISRGPWTIAVDIVIFAFIFIGSVAAKRAYVSRAFSQTLNFVTSEKHSGPSAAATDLALLAGAAPKVTINKKAHQPISPKPQDTVRASGTGERRAGASRDSVKAAGTPDKTAASAPRVPKKLHFFPADWRNGDVADLVARSELCEGAGTRWRKYFKSPWLLYLRRCCWSPVSCSWNTDRQKSSTGLPLPQSRRVQ
jgi:hypothetical protein